MGLTFRRASVCACVIAMVAGSALAADVAIVPPATGARLLSSPDRLAHVALWRTGAQGGGTTEVFAFQRGGGAWSEPRALDGRLMLRYGVFDPNGKAPLVPAALAQPATGDGAYIVQVQGQLLPEFLADIRSLSIGEPTFLPHAAVIVQVSDVARATLTRRPYVRAVARYQPAYKLDEALLIERLGWNPVAQRPAKPTIDPEATEPYYVMALGRGLAVRGPLAKQIEALGGVVESNLDDPGYRLIARLNAAQLAAVAALPSVHFIDRWSPAEDDMDEQRIFGGANYVEGLTGFSGEGVRAEVMDGGIRATHVAFSPQPIIHGPPVTVVAHGTNCYGIIFGRGTGNAAARGMIPDAEQGFFAAYTTIQNGTRSRYTHTAQLLYTHKYAQTITITGTPTGGTFTITFLGTEAAPLAVPETTAPIAFNAPAATVQAALAALPSVGAANVAVFGGPGPGTAYVVEFRGAFDQQNTLLMNVAHAFIGGTAPAIATRDTSAGRCVFQSNSWGSNTTSAYTTTSAAMDDILFNNDIIICQSQSNTGTTASRPEAWAKNIVSIGGVNTNNTSVLTDDTQSTASIGPASDGRIKPDLCNSYNSVLTTTSTNDTAYTTGFNGTSSATPITAGHFGIFFQMWNAGLFGNTVNPSGTVFSNRPRASTSKAMMINTAQVYGVVPGTINLARIRQGWGLPDLRRLYDMRDRMIVQNEENRLEVGQSATTSFAVSGDGQPLKITMVFKDPQGNPAATVHRINDLSLRVVSPSGAVYWGNNGLLNGHWSTTGGAANTIDTVENVFVSLPAAGTWTVQVIASEVNQDADPSTPAMDVPYSLVVSGIAPAAWAPPCSAADIATEGAADAQAGSDGAITGADFDTFVLAFFTEIRRPTSVGPLLADVTNADGTGGPDGVLTGADFDFFIQAFFVGCP